MKLFRNLVHTFGARTRRWLSGTIRGRRCRCNSSFYLKQDLQNSSLPIPHSEHSLIRVILLQTVSQRGRSVIGALLP